jgi:acetylornithine deacetylase/succinyl-diaminopimelate desuccinylase-like protein
MSMAADQGLGHDAIALLQELIRFNTTNPPGNEEPAQELLRDRLAAAGFECELLAAQPRRPNLVATLHGDAPGSTLCLLGHVDTVGAEPAEWSFDPWSGDVVDGEVRGRGALDMKGQVAAEVAAVTALARAGWRPPRGDLKVVITVDEETDASLGARWLCEQHPEQVRADVVVNEGGGWCFEIGQRRYYPVAVGEKGICRFWLRARGVGGHASLPRLGDNALLKLAAALLRLREQPPLEPTPEGMAFLAGVLGRPADGADPEALLRALGQLAPEIADRVAEPMLGVTLVPTQARASKKGNVIPSLAEAFVDCRVPPGLGTSAALERIERVLGPEAGSVDVEVVQAVVGNSSPAESTLARTIRAWLARADPGAILVPMVMAGFSDSHWFRRAFPDATVYGFCPQRAFGELRARPLVHGVDERAAVADIALSASFFFELPQILLAQDFRPGG